MNHRPSFLPGVKPLSFFGFIFAAMVTGACDEPFSPIAPTEVQFSVFGYLDASADTQWVRVMPIRPQLLTSPESFGATVTLQRRGTGPIIEMRDSVFLFTDNVNPDLGSTGVYVHTFWTTETIEPGATYRFSVARNGEDPAEAVVEIPRDFEAEVWLKQGYGTDYLILDGVKNVPFVQANAHFYDRCGSSVDSVRHQMRSVEGDVHSIPIGKAEVTPREGCGLPGIEKRELWVVGSEAAWPSGQEYSPWGLAVQERPSNVTNALGFLGGVLTKIVPYESCTFQGGGAMVPEHCRLRYGQESASLSGTVIETRCGDGPMDSVTVELREMDVEPAALRKVRVTLTNRAGTFRIGGLESGGRYLLKVRAKPEPDPFWGEVDIHSILWDTLEFAPSQSTEYEALLRRFTECGSSQ